MKKYSIIKTNAQSGAANIAGEQDDYTRLNKVENDKTCKD